MERPPIEWLRERDVDLLLCSELHARGSLANFFAIRLGLEGGQLEGARVSHLEDGRESDLVISMVRDATRVLALVENKIAANFQPGQVAAYTARSLKWTEETGAPCRTVLVAPQIYFSHLGAEDFNVRISYEDMTAALRCSGDPRSQFLADVLLQGADASRRGYVSIADEVVTSLWDACWRLATLIAPLLNMEKPGDKPKDSTWVRFPKASGLSKAIGKRVSLVYKAERGQADLEFVDTDANELQYRAASVLAPDMCIRPAGKSASIRLVVPAVDFSVVEDDQAQRLAAGLLACERLRIFIVEHRDVLLADVPC